MFNYNFSNLDHRMATGPSLIGYLKMTTDNYFEVIELILNDAAGNTAL